MADVQMPTARDEETSKSKKGHRKRVAKYAAETIPKAKRKYTKRSRNSDDGAFDKIDRDKRGRKIRRKKESDDRLRPSRVKSQRKKSTPKNQSLIIDNLDNIEKIISSDEDSVVIMDEIPPSVTIPSTPPQNSPHSSDREPDRPRRLEDSSSDGNSSSSSSTDSDSEDSDTSISSRLTDKSDRSDKLRESPIPNNGYDHRSPSPLGGWNRYSSSGSENEDGVQGTTKNGAGPPSGTPPRSPSSASSEGPDKSFQCHTCRKWFSSTVTLRIHKRTHVQRPGGASSGSRSSRRYECDCCDATFTRRERLEQHRSERHRGSLTERCEVCGRGFEDEEQQKRHAALHTADERAGRCTECGKITGGWDQLRRHRAAHASPAVHACPLCRKAFTYMHSLSRHLLNHSKAVYKCVVCKTSFDDANALASHLNSHLDRYKQLKT